MTAELEESPSWAMVAARWVVLVELDRPRVCPYVRRMHPKGCPSCARELEADGGHYCETCGVFRCPTCRLWRCVQDGGGDDPDCNECWSRKRQQRLLAARRLSEHLRANRWRREAAAAVLLVLAR